MLNGPIAVCGLEEEVSLLTELATDLDLEAVALDRALIADPAAATRLPGCVLVDWRSPDGRAACAALRRAPEGREVPVIAIVGNPWSAEVSEAFTLGADDFVPAEQIGEIRYKLLALGAKGVAIVGPHLTGQVVLADADRMRRIHLARHLRRMGLDVRFAADAGELPLGEAVKLVVAHGALPPAGAAEALRAYRERGGAAVPWVITGRGGELGPLRERLGGVERVTLFDSAADPAQIVFHANQLFMAQDPGAAAKRRSRRLPYETVVRWRVGGGGPAWGYSYNISRGGLYVRTLSAPGLGTDIDLELRAPFGRGRVRVQATVVWRQEYAPVRGYPPGFGVQFGDLPLADGAALEAGYAQLLQQEEARS